METGELPTVEQLASPYREGVPGFVAGNRDRFEDDVVGGEENVVELASLEFLERFHGPAVALVARVEQRDEEAGVDEDHLCL